MRKKFYTEEELVFEEKPKSKQFKDIEGQEFGRLTVMGFAGDKHWFCRCECGNITRVFSGRLKDGTTNSCGCFRIKRLKETHTTHGHRSGNSNTTLTYGTWSSMMTRCLNSKSTYFYNYGGRGIKVCERWLRFENFLEDMGERPKGMFIERVNNDGNYEPGNCRWATKKEQANNTRCSRLITFNGKTMTVAQWSKEIGINCKAIYKRLDRGWTAEIALTTPTSEL